MYPKSYLAPVYKLFYVQEAKIDFFGFHLRILTNTEIRITLASTAYSNVSPLIPIKELKFVSGLVSTKEMVFISESHVELFLH